VPGLAGLDVGGGSGAGGASRTEILEPPQGPKAKLPGGAECCGSNRGVFNHQLRGSKPEVLEPAVPPRNSDDRQSHQHGGPPGQQGWEAPQPSLRGSATPGGRAVIRQQRGATAESAGAHAGRQKPGAGGRTPLRPTIRAKGESAALQEATPPPKHSDLRLEAPASEAWAEAARSADSLKGAAFAEVSQRQPARPTVTWAKRSKH